MRKLVLLAIAICASFISIAQNNWDTILNGNPVYFLSDTNAQYNGGHWLPTGCTAIDGLVFRFEESDSMKIWGLACSYDTVYPNAKCNPQIYFFKVDDDFDSTGQPFIWVDSVTLIREYDVDIDNPSRYMRFSSGNAIKMYEVYFDTVTTLVGTYGVCILNLHGESGPYITIPDIRGPWDGIMRMQLQSNDFNPDGKSRAFFFKGEGNVETFPIYLITDSSLRDHRIEPPQPPAEPCPPVGLLSIDSLGARCVRLSWTDSVERCYYEVAMGPVSSPLDSLAFYTTTDTSFFFDHLPPGVPYKAFVRGACDCDGDMSPWGNLVSFTYSPYHLNLSVNNPDWGSVYGGGEYYGETQLEISASPVDDNATFDGWDDGNVENPRSIFLTQDTSFTAIFSYDSTGLGLSTPSNFGLSVSPNPVRHTLKVRTSVDVMGSLEIYNAEGQRLLSFPMDGREARLDVSRLPSGQYLLSLRTREATFSAKFVKR